MKTSQKSRGPVHSVPMQSFSTDDLRQAYLDFFRGHGHAVIPGAPLVPENDPTVLFTTAGMHPLVPYLMGEKHPAGKRLVDVQRCVRTGDIDEVGDASHLTMFEMMGNWSLGDYFKEGAITMSFEFLTKVLGIPVDMLAVTCFEGDSDAPRDDESATIWMKTGIPKERIGFLPKAKNWWGPAGKTGPCGPDTEMFYWIGEGEPRGNPATHDAEWLEIWNDVFMQYNKKEDGTFEPLKQQNVDTGMGLERVVKVLQGVESVYETDRMKPIKNKVLSYVDEIAKTALSKQPDFFGPRQERAARIITDHIKAATFIIADGIQPSNREQGHILRRLIRRTIIQADTHILMNGLSDDHNFCSKISEEVIHQYKEFYPYLHEQEQKIVSALQKEEEQFSKTLKEGSKKFRSLTKEMPIGTRIEGQAVFHLFDTYGFPVELTKEMAAESKLTIDEQGFQKAFEEHQTKSRAGAEKKFAGGLADHSAETTKLHTATHLLNAALHTVLGSHIQQKGSNITAERLRFDFNHSDKMTPEQIKKVEDLVNEAIKADLPVAYHLTTVDGAKNEGAIGVFDDRYGSEVKVYVMGPSTSSGGHMGKEPFSKEICGGPHVGRTGMLGAFKIQKEESSSAGVRRIKAVLSGGPVEIEVAREG